ncbi:Cell fusion protein cfr1 [Colletotrichum chlorophyti]|uniref:Cell fusion protein cfr1 n=1 Tax=Colletotrichum chlorophyti TaxID=708187 RepID=A0A1Q8S515_9PEZI|nr:Cell fusion protein cfr1 [Colletotrichum chlorophyti]
MLVSLTVGKVDAGVTVLLTPDKRLIEFPSILLPPNISSGSIVDITVARNLNSESKTEQAFRELQDRIYSSFGASAPTTPVLRCRNATQTSVVLEWDPIELATADLISLSLYRNGQKAGNIPRPLQMHSTKISGLAVDTDYTFHLVLRTTAGTLSSEKVVVRTHKMTDLSGITITTGIMPAATREALTAAVERIGAKIVDSVRIDTTHFVTTEGRGLAWEKAVETNIPVVRPEWVEACEKNGRILGVTKFYLDALRPGPPSDELQQAPSPQQPPPQTQKELPSPPTTNSAENGDAAATSGAGLESSAKSPEGSDKPPTPKAEGEQASDHDEDKEAEQKRIADQEEQKVRLEDKDEQKLAHRPKEDGSESGSNDGRSDEDNPNEKPGTSPDGASFQDVAL